MCSLAEDHDHRSPGQSPRNAPNAIDCCGFSIFMQPQVIWIFLLVSFLLFPSSVLAEESVLLIEDFDGETKLSNRWTAAGEIQVARVNYEPNAPDEINGAEGRVAECKASPRSLFLAKRGLRRPPFEHFDQIRFRIQVSEASAESPVTFEFQVRSEQRPATLWRKFVVDKDTWQVVTLPMQHFRYSSGSSLDWTEVSRIGVVFRERCDVKLDGFELVSSEKDSDPYFTPEEVGAFAFGEQLKTTSNERFAIMTDDDRVDRKRTLEQCDRLYELVFRDFPKLDKPKRQIPILVFSTERKYREFWPRLGSLYVASVPPVKSTGYSLLGIAGTFYSDKFGDVRPVLIHEACHAMLAPSIGLSNSSEWLHEGLANYYQLDWTKQDIHKLNRARLRNGKMRPLRELLSGQRIPMDDYAQVTLWTKWLLSDELRRKQFAKALREMRKRNSTRLEPICEDVFGEKLGELELGWLRWCEQQGNG